MAILLIEGFDWCNTGTTGQTELTTNKWTTNTLGGSSGPTTTNSRFGTGKCYAFVDGEPFGRLGYTFPSAKTTVFCGFAWRMPTIGTARWIVTFRDGSVDHIGITLNTSGKLEVRRGATSATTGTILGTTTKTFLSNTWYYIEIKMTIDNTAGVIELRVDGTADITLSSQDTQNAGNASVDSLLFPSGGSGSLDDFYLLDTTGSTNTTFIGDSRVDTSFPNADGTTLSWTASAGNRFACVDEVPPNEDTDYISTSTAGNVNHFEVTDATTGGTIKAVQFGLRAKKTDAGSTEIKPVVRVAGTDYVHATSRTLTTNYSNYVTVYDVNADGNAWDHTSFNSTQFGVKREV